MGLRKLSLGKPGFRNLGLRNPRHRSLKWGSALAVVAFCALPDVAASATPGALPPARPAAEALLPDPATLAVRARRAFLRDALAAAKSGESAKAAALAKAHGDPALAVAAEWMVLRGGQPRFEDVHAFLDRHPTWPDADRLLRLAERDLYRRPPADETVLAAFAKHPPVTDLGRRAHARALVETGDPAGARAAIAEIYRELRMDANEERAFLKVYGPALTSADHAERATYQLYFERVQAAERAVARSDDASAKRRVSICAAAIRKAGLPTLGDAERRDPHVAFCLAERTQPFTAAHHLARVTGDGDAIGPRSRLSQRRDLAREMLDAGQTTLAYEVAANHGITEPAQAAEAEALAGWIALRGLGDPDRAEPHFRRLATLTSYPISQARAAYWLGRVHDARDEMVEAVRSYRTAAAQSTTYYGQLAHARMGLRGLELAARPEATPGARLGFENRLATRAAHLLAGAGEEELAVALAQGMADGAQTAVEADLAGRLVAAFGSARAQVVLGKRASYRGISLDRYAFPMLDVILAEGRTGVGAAMLHGVARQESLFDTTAGSHVGAKGLMQLMPGTAREVSGWIGQRYTQARLTRDPAYNVALGSAYLANLDRRFAGSQPMMFAGYNAGPGRVNQWVRRYGDPRDSVEAAIDWVERIPFDETRNYVMRVMENVAVYEARLKGGAAPLDVAHAMLGRDRRDLMAIASAGHGYATSPALRPVSQAVQAFSGLPPTPRARIKALGGAAAALLNEAAVETTPTSQSGAAGRVRVRFSSKP